MRRALFALAFTLIGVAAMTAQIPRGPNPPATGPIPTTVAPGDPPAWCNNLPPLLRQRIPRCRPSPPPTTTRATGAYQASDYLQTYAIVLPDDMYYEFRQRVDADGSIIELWSLTTGQGKSDNGRYGALVTNFFDGYSRNLLISAKYIPAASVTGTMTFLDGGTFRTFEFTAVPASVLDLNIAADLSQITGTWKAWGLCEILVGGAEGNCEPYTVTISATGEFWLSGWGWDCPFATMTPDPASGYFNVKFATGPGTCFPTGASGSGIAIEMLLPSGIRELLVAIVGKNDASRAGGVAFAAQR